MSFGVYRKDSGKPELPLLHPTEAKPVINRQEAQQCLESHQACVVDPGTVYIREVPDYTAPAPAPAAPAAQ